MFFSSIISTALVLSASAIASPIGKVSVIEKLNGPPVGWAKDESIVLDRDAEGVKLRIHLVQQDMDKFHELAMDVCLNSNSY